MPSMIGPLGIAVYFSCGATACFLLGRRLQRTAEYFNSITRVIDLRRLDLLTTKTTKLLVVVSGRVASAAPFDCKEKGPLAVLLEEKAQLDLQIKTEDGGLINKSMSYLLQQKETPWYLEDSTGRVDIVGAQHALGFDNTLKEYVLDTPAAQLISSVVKPQGSKVLAYCFRGHSLNIGTLLTFVGEAVRDKAGTLMIQKHKEQPFMVFSGEGSFDKMVDDIKSNSEDYIFLSKIFGTIAVVVAVMYGVDFIRGLCLESDSDSEETYQGAE